MDSEWLVWQELSRHASSASIIHPVHPPVISYMQDDGIKHALLLPKIAG